MTIIGTFTLASDGVFRGALRTLAFSAKGVEIRPLADPRNMAPDHRVACGQAEIGATWTVTRAGKPPCLSVRIDDPGLPAPLNALLVRIGETEVHELRWSRRRSR